MRNVVFYKVRLFLLIFAMWFCPIIALAEFSVTFEEKITSEYLVVNANKKQHVLANENAKAEYVFDIFWEGIDSVSDIRVVAATYSIEKNVDLPLVIKIDEEEDKLYVDPIVLPLTAGGEHSFKYNIQLEYKLFTKKNNNLVESTIIHESFDGSSACPIQVWPKPVVTSPQLEFKAMLPKEIVTFEINYKGGVDQGWQFMWAQGAPKGEPATKCEYKTTEPVNNDNNPERQEITVKCRNIAPDNSTVWFEETKRFIVNVYSNPNAEQGITSEAAYPSEDLTYVVKPSGGNPEDWQYVWSEGQSLGNTLKITTVNDNKDVSISKEVSVIVRNFSPEGALWYEKEFIWPLTIYPTPNVNISQELPVDIFSGNIVPIDLNVEGGQSNAWSYKWYVDNEYQSDYNLQNVFKYDARNNEHEPIVKSVKVVATNNASGVSVPYSKTLEHNFVVWSGSTLVTYNGQFILMGLAQDHECTYSWRKNGNALSNSGSVFTTEVVNNNEDGSHIEDVYSLLVRNSNGEAEEYTFTIVIYPKPRTELANEDFNFYYGETASLLVPTGGYPDGWKFYYDGIPDELIIEAGDANGYEKNVKITVINCYHNIEWFREELDLNYKAWSTGEISGYLDRVEYNGYADFELIGNHIGGYPEGWSFAWIKNGNDVDNENTNVIMVNESNPDDIVRQYKYVLHAENKIGDRVGLKKDVEFTFNVWPIIQLPTESHIEVSETRIREGNNLFLRIPKALGGYEYKWNYNWMYRGETIGHDNELSLVLDIEAGNTMNKTVHNYTLSIMNPGPNGEEPWVEVLYNVPDVIVYRRPLTPTKLVRKGNGASCTMVALVNEYDDEQLTLYDYNFIFGYTSKDGVDHFMPETKNRYYKFEESVYNNSGNKFWVLSSWNYEDGSLVTSGKRFLDGSKDEKFDASKYDDSGSDGGRGGNQSGLNAIDDSDFVHISDKGFVASSMTSQKVYLNIYSLDGTMVFHKVYFEDTYLNETFEGIDLASGMYIIKVYMGDLVEVKKVIIK